ncbi:uncharacterized protein [Amphiura filiformis]|uniref:uncharacterized protein n=1 Tax=Amphiura filiformis TaxID=82378 RepID=UPI003B21C016
MAASINLQEFHNFIQCYEAIQIVCEKAVLPCVENTIRGWHNTKQVVLHTTGQLANLQPCSSPPQCPSIVRDSNRRRQPHHCPVHPPPCQNCIQWCHAIESLYWTNERPKSGAPVTWGNISPPKLFHDSIEFAKAFAVSLPPGPSPTSFGDFDHGCLLKMAMRFGECHSHTQANHDIMQKVYTVRNNLCHKRLSDNLQLSLHERNDFFNDIFDLVDLLESLHPNYFPKLEADDVRDELLNIQAQPVTQEMKERAASPLTAEMKQWLHQVVTDSEQELRDFMTQQTHQIQDTVKTQRGQQTTHISDKISNHTRQTQDTIEGQRGQPSQHIDKLSNHRQKGKGSPSSNTEMTSSPMHQEETSSTISANEQPVTVSTDEQSASQDNTITGPTGTKGLSDLSELLSLQDIFKDHQQDKQLDDRGINMYVNNPSVMKNQTVVTGDHIHVDQQNIYVPHETGTNESISQFRNPLEKVDMEIPIDMMLEQHSLQPQQHPSQQQPRSLPMSQLSTHEGQAPSMQSALMPVYGRLQDSSELGELQSTVQDAIHNVDGNQPIVIMHKPTIVKGGVTQVTGNQYNIGQQSTTYMHKEVDISKWRERLQKKYNQDGGRIRFGRSRKAVADTDDIFVDLTLLEERLEESSKDLRARGSRSYLSNREKEYKNSRKLESYEELFTITCTKSCKKANDQVKAELGGEFAHHILLQGPAGSGKTTLVHRIAYMWANRKLGFQCSIPSNPGMPSMSRAIKEIPSARQNGFDLVFFLELRKLKSEQCLEQAIQAQLLPDVPKASIAKAITSLGSKCLIIFDGFDEIHKDLHDHALESPLLSSCFVVVTTRPHMVDQFCRSQDKSGYVHVRISGFPPEKSKIYIGKFFHRKGQLERGNSLIEKIDSTPILQTLSCYPILLVMICILWEVLESNDTAFQTMTGLYEKAVIYLNKPFQEKHHMSPESIEHMLIKLGEPALEELLRSNLQIRSDRFDENILHQSFEVGLTIQEEGALLDETYVIFIHKTFQEFCAAKYLAYLHDNDPAAFKAKLDLIHKYNVLAMDYVLQFCCGLCADATSVLQHVVNLFTRFHIDGTSRDVMHRYRSKQEWTLSLTFIYEAEMYHRSGDSSKLHTELKPLRKFPLRLDNLSTLNAFCYFALTKPNSSIWWIHETAKVKILECKIDAVRTLRSLCNMKSLTSLSLSGLTLSNSKDIKHEIDESISMSYGSLKEFEIKYSLVSTNTMMKLLDCMPSVTSVSIKSVTLSEIDIKGEKLKCASSVRVTPVSLDGAVNDNEPTMFRGSLSTNTIMRVLGCMPSASSLSLRLWVHIENEVDESISVQCGAIKEFKMDGLHGRSTVSANKMMRLLGCMPSVASVSLSEVDIKGEVDESISVLCGSLKEFKMFGSPYKAYTVVSANAMMRLLGCMPSVASVSLSEVDIKGEVDESISVLCGSLKEFKFARSSVSANAMMRLLGCMPSVASVSLSEVDIKGEVDESISVLCGSLKEFTMFSSPCKKAYTVMSANAMLRLLGCMPSVTYIGLSRVQLTGKANEYKMLSLESLKTFKMGGALHVSVLKKLLSCMPLDALVNDSMFTVYGPCQSNSGRNSLAAYMFVEPEQSVNCLREKIADKIPE